MPFVNSSVQTDEVSLTYRSDPKLMSYLPALSTSFSSLKILSANKESYMSRKFRKWMCLLLLILGIGCLGLLYSGYFYPEEQGIFILTQKMDNNPTTQPLSKINDIGKLISNSVNPSSIPTFEDIVSKDFQFNIEGHDVMVFLHMQKTGGTIFGKHLVNDLELARECVCHRKIKKRCTCLRPGLHSDETWLFSRYSTGWKCGLHADWTELTSCVDEAMDEIDDISVRRRYFYITYLRDPISRYLSEFRHVQRGATWKNALLFCNGRSATREEVPPCYKGSSWEDVSIEEFLSCSSNLANNRQTRMLADLSLVDCYEKGKWTQTERDMIMLASAKNNLLKMSFFGLTEMQEISQYIFEETFNLNFNVRFKQFNQTNAKNAASDINKATMDRIREANKLDIELYSYGKDLLFKRFDRLKALDPHYEEHFKNMGHGQFSWENVDKDR